MALLTRLGRVHCLAYRLYRGGGHSEGLEIIRFRADTFTYDEKRLLYFSRALAASVNEAEQWSFFFVFPMVIPSAVNIVFHITYNGAWHRTYLAGNPARKVNCHALYTRPARIGFCRAETILLSEPYLVSAEQTCTEAGNVVMSGKQQLRSFGICLRRVEKRDNLAHKQRMEFGVKLIHHQTFAIVQRIYDRICTRRKYLMVPSDSFPVKRKATLWVAFPFIIVLTMAAYDAVVNLGYVVYAQIRIFGETNYTLTHLFIVQMPDGLRPHFLVLAYRTRTCVSPSQCRILTAVVSLNWAAV